jgi:regulator of protease activity HflC (stomatin/prohibitin superfamily)
MERQRAEAEGHASAEDGGSTMIRERENRGLSGLPVLLVLLAVSALCIWGIVTAARADSPVLVVASAVTLAGMVFLMAGLFVVNPNEGRVLQLFGDYRGTARVAGLRWANPFFTKKRISLRVRNFESSRLKVNDIEGNPIEIAAVVVWQVVDTAEAVFEVDDYNNYVKVQSESALRNLTTSYPYDAHDDAQMSLRGHTAAVAEHLKKEIQDRLARAGVEVIEARISHLAYAPEIAASMLQRQQAGAIIAARTRIVEGAVGMVEMALELLSRRDIVELDNERKAAMVSNLLVVLCGERSTQPIVNAGSIY